MPPYLQASILAVQDKALRQRLMGDEDLAETHYQYGQAAAQLRRTDPGNPLLNVVRSADWLPSDDDVAQLQAAVRTAATSQPRPSWPQSEADVGRDLGPGARSQVSFKDGKEVSFGTPGSVRPDFVQDGVATFEVKNYNIATNSDALIRNVADQAIKRAEHLPEGMIQQVIIDIRGQSVPFKQREDIVEKIATRASHKIDENSIEFKE